MSYPPSWRQVADPDFSVALMREHPFAHLVTANGALAATRIPFLVDCVDAHPVGLRAHLNAQNAQALNLEGSAALVVFSGSASYVSPHWRTSPTRAGTFDYEEVQVRGRVRIEPDIGFFRALIDGLSALIEPRHADIGNYPTWTTAMAPEGYVERLFPQIICFSIEIESLSAVSKLHQQFPAEDRRLIAAHLARSRHEASRAIAAKMRQTLTPDATAPAE
jgi:transcriptional regulator